MIAVDSIHPTSPTPDLIPPVRWNGWDWLELPADRTVALATGFVLEVSESDSMLVSSIADLFVCSCQAWQQLAALDNTSIHAVRLAQRRDACAIVLQRLLAPEAIGITRSRKRRPQRLDPEATDQDLRAALVRALNGTTGAAARLAIAQCAAATLPDDCKGEP